MIEINDIEKVLYKIFIKKNTTIRNGYWKKN